MPSKRILRLTLSTIIKVLMIGNVVVIVDFPLILEYSHI